MLFEKPSVNLSMAATRRSARINGRAKIQPPRPTEPSPSKSPRLPRTKRKHQAITGEEAAELKTPPPPSKKKKKKGALGHDGRPPTTPLPSSAKLMYQPQPQDGNAHEAVGGKLANRLADPYLTNATLLSPETARVVASREVEEPSTPSKASSLGTARPTTQTLLREACEHLIRVDARMKPLIEKVECAIFTPAGLVAVVDPFESLASSIISQQVSGAAAKSIKAKFVALFDQDDDDDKRFPPPSKVAACSVERLREAGLSQRKAEYIQGLAEKFASGELNTLMLHDAPYEELVEKLVAVRGLGKWSVEMFALFGLKRMDVFSLGDLGVQRGCAAFVGRDVAKLKAKGGKWKYMSEQDMLELSSRFAPYRSLFMWYMWQVEAVDISVLE